METAPAAPDRPGASGPIWRRAVQSGLEHVFGDLPIDLDAEPGDAGLCGPESASWRVIADPAAMVGGFRALLVQLLHPHAMAGVFDHSEFRTDSLGRLRRTSAYVLATTFGSTREAFAVSRLVRRTHLRVHGTAPDGSPYRADDPHLLAWVSIALTSSFLAAHEAYGGHALRAEQADAFVAEQSRLSALLDPRVNLDELERDSEALAAVRQGEHPLPMLEEGRLPLTVRQLEAVLASYDPELGLNEQGREGMRFLLWPPVPPAMKLGYLPVLTGALATIEPRRRALLGPAARLLSAPPAATNARAVVALLRRLRGPSPVFLAATARAGAAD
jgi:hypothetical protein